MSGKVWYKDRSGRGGWTEAPHLSEEVYNLEDALVVAQWLNVFLRKCDVLKIACVAQIVNVISWLQTTPDGLLKQTSFYPFRLVSQLARGQFAGSAGRGAGGGDQSLWRRAYAGRCRQL